MHFHTDSLCSARCSGKVNLMRALPVLLLAAVCVGWGTVAAPVAHAEPSSSHVSSEPVKQELTAVIDGQLAAFRAGDYPKAYTFAAGGIKEMFPVENFEMMVKTAYPLIAGSAKAEYGLAFDTGEDAVVNVTVEDAKGQRAQYQYTLSKEKGVWKITGVVEQKPEGTTV